MPAMNMPAIPQTAMSPMGMPQMGMPPMGMPQMGMPMMPGMMGMMPMMPNMMPAMMPMMGMMPGVAPMPCRMTMEMGKDGIVCKMMPVEGMTMEMLRERCESMMKMMSAGTPMMMACGNMMLAGMMTR